MLPGTLWRHQHVTWDRRSICETPLDVFILPVRQRAFRDHPTCLSTRCTRPPLFGWWRELGKWWASLKSNLSIHDKSLTHDTKKVKLAGKTASLFVAYKIFLLSLTQITYQISNLHTRYLNTIGVVSICVWFMLWCKVYYLRLCVLAKYSWRFNNWCVCLNITKNCSEWVMTPECAKF